MNGSVDHPDHRREGELLNAALELMPEDRRAFLDRACGVDATLRERLERLLAAHAHASAFLENVSVPGALGNDQETVPNPPSVFPGNIGRYRLLEKIGEGGCGVVYMADQEEPVRRRVALKIIKPGMDSRQVIARFEAERQALALMDHPNIAKVFDGGVTDRKAEGGSENAEGKAVPSPDSSLLTAASGRPYFVMELVRGTRITDYCEQHQLSTRQRLDLFMQVCSAIQHAHQKGIIHRDIKPSNVLVSENDGKPVPKVIDFGIAKATEQKLTDKTLFTPGRGGRFNQGTVFRVRPGGTEFTTLYHIGATSPRDRGLESGGNIFGRLLSLPGGSVYGTGDYPDDPIYFFRLTPPGLRLAAARLGTNLQLTATGTTNIQWHLESRDTLSGADAWQPLTNITLEPSPTLIQQPLDATNRFYRGAWVP